MTNFVDGSCIGHYVKCLACKGCKILVQCRKATRNKSFLKDNFAASKKDLKKILSKMEKNEKDK